MSNSYSTDYNKATYRIEQHQERKIAASIASEQFDLHSKNRHHYFDWLETTGITPDDVTFIKTKGHRGQLKLQFHLRNGNKIRIPRNECPFDVETIFSIGAK